MAAKKKEPAKKKEKAKPKKRDSSLVVRTDSLPSTDTELDAYLGQLAQEGAAGEVVEGAARIKVESGEFAYSGKEGEMILEQPLPVVILDDRRENVYYDVPFDRDNPSPPACFAIAKADVPLVPHPSIESPIHATCEGCPFNEWGSADVGKGKKCGNRRRLALIGYKGFADMDSEIVRFDISPTSVSAFSSFKKRLADSMKLPTFGVVTHLTTEPQGTYSLIGFEATERVKSKEDLAIIIALRKQSETLLDQVYQLESPTEKPAKKEKGAKKKGKKF